jgi:site-specific recombinase XerC
MVAVRTGLRVSELTGLCCGDVHLGRGAHVRCMGKRLASCACRPARGGVDALLCKDKLGIRQSMGRVGSCFDNAA